MEAAAIAGRTDLLQPIIEVVVAAQHPDGYLHSYDGLEPFGFDPGSGGEPGRYRDLTSSHELYCAGHFIEAALAHRAATGSKDLLLPAIRLADHLCDTFGPGRDPRIDDHPEIEVAMARLSVQTGNERYLDFARWTIEALSARAGLTLDTLDLAGHAVKALHLASGIAEVALATGDAARRSPRLISPGGSTPSPATSAVSIISSWCCTTPSPAGWVTMASRGSTVSRRRGTGGRAEQPEQNPWAQPYEYQERMQLEWFPPHRHHWFDVTCCPPNLARMFAAVPGQVAALDADGSLRIDLPVAAHPEGGGWDVRLSGRYPDEGTARIRVDGAPGGARGLRVRVPGARVQAGRWLTIDGTPGTDVSVEVPVERTWLSWDQRVLSAIGRRYLRQAPIVYCAEVPANSTTDLRTASEADVVGGHLAVTPYHRWANAGPSRMTVLLRSGFS
jgi:DUF1680 family protein